DPTNENIKQFVAGKVWRQKLGKYLDASDFSKFKKSPSSLKSLENFVAESLKIHIEYLVAVRNKEKPSYNIDQASTELSSDNE
ncbi:4487_t:CDS:2, partial [Racocetra fulgida]